VNQYGQSQPIATNSLAVTAGQQVDIVMTPVNGAAKPVTYYKVWRTLRGGAAASARLILRFKNTTGVAAETIEDKNESLPRCTKGFMFQQDSSNMSWAQLAPMVKVPLATIDTSIRWMQLIYGTPKLYTPRHNVLFTNIGRAEDFVGTP
jgi:hypothetical protein